MPFVTITSYGLRCDYCLKMLGGNSPLHLPKKAGIKALASGAGWLFSVGGEACCPRCHMRPVGEN